MNPLDDAANYPAVKLGNQSFLLQNGEERSWRQKPLLLLLKANQDFLEGFFVSTRCYGSNFLAIENKFFLLKSRSEDCGNSLFRHVVSESVVHLEEGWQACQIMALAAC